MFADLRHRLDDAPTYAGEFETHLTVAPLDAVGLSRFVRVCDELGVKCVQIELARGQTRSQPMTGSHDHGTAQQALAQALALAERLEQRGFAVTRVKIEAAPGNADLPQDAAEAGRLPAHNYFEHHLKLLLPETLDLAPLVALVVPFHAHLSRNAFKRREDGQAERFVTLRAYGLGRAEATARAGALRDALTQAGFTVLKMVAEYCFFDSNEQVDAGWLAEPPLAEDRSGS